MKNNYTSVSKRNNCFRNIFVFFLTITGVTYFNIAQAQTPYRVEGDSQVKVAIDSTKGNFTATANLNELSVACDFVMKDGVLDNVNSFKLTMPIAKSNNLNGIQVVDSLGFKLTHVMVLPMMRLIHIVGMMDVGGVSSRTELDFNFVVNEDQSISLFGTKSIKLSDYNKDVKFNAVALKENKEVKLNLNLLFKSDQAKLAALDAIK